MERKATIFDLERLCKGHQTCSTCPLDLLTGHNCVRAITESAKEANDIIVKWCDEHPAKTLQTELLAILPTAPRDEHNVIDICPQVADKKYWAEDKGYECFGGNDCFKCRCAFWLDLR